MREQRRLQIFHLAFACLMGLVVMAAALGVMFLSAPPELRPTFAREPFILSVLIASGCGLVIMVLGTGGILRASRPLFERIDESEERSRELLEATTDGVVDFDDRGKITALNPAALRAFGYSRKALLGQQITRLLIGHGWDGGGETPAVQRGSVKPPPAAPQAVLDDLLRPIRGLKTQGRRMDGNVFPVEVTIVEQHGGTRYVAVIRDLSESEQQQRELSESEERFRILSRAAFEGIAILDEDRILDHNQALTQMLARGSENLSGHSLYDVFHTDSHAGVRASILASEDSSREVQALRSDGGTFPCEIAVKRIPYRGHRAVVIALRDISERKHAEGVIQQFHRSEAELAAIQKTAATYAHEINNPLTGVLGMLQMLIDEENDRERLTMLSDALMCSRRIKDVMNKLSQITSPKYRNYLREETEIIDINAAEEVGKRAAS
jgi:PAS domain S-box-containing protein